MKDITQTAPALSAQTWFVDENADDLDGTEPFVIRCHDGSLKQTLALATVHQWEGQSREEAKRNAEFIVRACTAFSDLAKVARYLKLVCQDRLADLREEREQLEPSDDYGGCDDIDERIEHYELLQADANDALAKAYGKAS